MCDPSFFRPGTNELVIGIHGGTNGIKPTGLEFSGVVSHDNSAVSGLPDWTGPHDRLYCSAIEPNPVRADARIMVYVPRALPVEMQLFDVQGRLVHDLGRQSLAEGYHVVSIHDLTDAGMRLVSGIYHLSIQAGGHREIRKLVILR